MEGKVHKIEDKENEAARLELKAKADFENSIMNSTVNSEIDPVDLKNTKILPSLTHLKHRSG